MLEFLRSLVLLEEAQHTQGNQGTQVDQENQGYQNFKTSNRCLVQEVLCSIQNSPLKEPPSRCKSMSNNFTFRTAGGRITCLQCNAKSKRTKLRCRAPAAKGKTKCRFHGGASTGPKTEQGRQRCADAKTIHGNETRQARTERTLVSARLAVLDSVGHQLGFMSGARTRGPKPTRMSEAYPELQACLKSAN
jgi:hypothetical protein